MTGCRLASTWLMTAGLLVSLSACEKRVAEAPPPATGQDEMLSVKPQIRTAPQAAPRPSAISTAAERQPQVTTANPVTTHSAPDEVANGPPDVDPQLVLSAGIRALQGRHLTLYTDHPPQADVDELPAVFDQAVPQWCGYFDIDPDSMRNWHVTACLMVDNQKFAVAGLLPPDLPPFLHGFHQQNRVWFYEQPSAYYRRHLLLHEGTHSFMFHTLGGAGPPWYMEGTAELLATHRWQAATLQLRYFPQSKEETPQWGRIKIIKDDFDAGRALPLSDIMQYDVQAHLRVEPYAWSWAAASFFDTHPETQAAFRALKQSVAEDSFSFSRAFYARIAGDGRQLEEQWQLFVAGMDYGYDLERAIVRHKESYPIQATERREITTDHGWQSTGLRLEAGKTYHVQAVGRYQIKQQPEVWWSEPGGVTIEYHDGFPRGMLLGAIRQDDEDWQGTTPLAQPVAIGLGRDVQPARSGTLYLRINEPPGELSDNVGSIAVQVRPAGA